MNCIFATEWKNDQSGTFPKNWNCRRSANFTQIILLAVASGLPWDTTTEYNTSNGFHINGNINTLYYFLLNHIDQQNYYSNCIFLTMKEYPGCDSNPRTEIANTQQISLRLRLWPLHLVCHKTFKLNIPHIMELH